MAYAASVSLMDAVERFYNSPDRFVHIHCPKSIPFLERLQEMAKSMRHFDFEKYRPVGGEHLEKQIRDAFWRAEDIVESYWLSLFHSSESENSGDDMDSTNPSKFFQDIQEVVQEIKSGMKRMTKFAYDQKHGNQDSISHAASVFSSIKDLSPHCKNKMVGLDRELGILKHLILDEITNPNLGAIVIYGMGGIGKTSLAITFYNDSDVRNYFSMGAWIKISLQHCVRDILVSLLHTMEVFNHGEDEEIVNFGLMEDNIDDDRLEKIVRERLVNERYLLVVDCLCEININSWNYIKSIVPDSSNSSRVILVNRWNFDDEFVLGNFRKCLLDIPNSWNILRRQVFGDEPCSHVLERIGKRIAKNCQGLPLAINIVGFHLAKGEKTAEYWNKIADSGNSIAYAVDGAPMFECLGLSFKQMPQFLRPVFLYLAAFANGYKIHFPEFMYLMVAEGFMRQEEYGIIEALISSWIQYFEDRSLVLSHEKDLSFYLHHTLWHLCRNQAQKDEFFHVMNMHNDWEDFPPSTNTNNVRRLVISKNDLLYVKDIFKLEHSILSNIRSILLKGPQHPYPITISWGTYKMLRVLDACSIRFYEFPHEILSLMLLRHLTLTLNRAEVPSEISRLRNLQFLIVLSLIKVVPFGEAPSYLPIEIWEMQQLLHLEVEGSDLPVPPPHSDAKLPNLLALGVSPHSCIKEVLERIPNLRILGIFIDLAPKIDSHAAPLCPFDHLIHLHQLRHLTCRITNPYFEGHDQLQLISMPEIIRVSMNNVTHLFLSGCGLPWKSIKQITRLPALELLHLEKHAFRGPKWKLSNKRFKRLEFLYLEDLDLVHWTARSGEFFPCLRNIRITRCHKMLRIPSAFKHCRVLDLIQVFDSSREAETWAQSIQAETSRLGNRTVMFSSPRGASRRTN